MPTFVKRSVDEVYRWDRFRDYETITETDTEIRLRFDETENIFESDRSPWEVQFVITDDVITRVRWFSQDGETLAVLKDTNLDLGLAKTFASEQVNNPNDIYDLLIKDGARFEGSVAPEESDAYFDVLTGVGDDKVYAFGSNSYIKDRGGADRYIGDENFDTVTYSDWLWDNPAAVQSGIFADLRSGYVDGPDGERDILRHIDSIRGTFLDDTILGNGDFNYLMGLRGDDLIDGRGGRDRVSYRQDENQGGDAGVTVNLRNKFAIDGFGTQDTLLNIEEAEGTDFNDLFIGSGGDNYFRGRDGNDKFILRGGNDSMDGGDGADKFVFVTDRFGYDQIRDFTAGDGDCIRIVEAASVDDLTISVDDFGVEIRLNGNAAVYVDNFQGDITDYLLFA